MCGKTKELAVFLIMVHHYRNNRIRDLPQELERCTKLSDVVLSFNLFQKLPPVLYTLKALENIIASDNQVCTFIVEVY